MRVEYDSFRSLIEDKEKLKGFKFDKTSENKDTNKTIESINKQIYKNENQKRKFKKSLLYLISFLTIIQLIFFNAVVVYVVLSLTSKWAIFKNLDAKTTSETLSFLKYYIGATVVELLGMLLFITRYVFTDTIAKHYKSTS